MRYIVHFRLKGPSLILFFLLYFLMIGGCNSRGGNSEVPPLSYTPAPMQNASGVPINTKIQLFFNAPLDPASIKPDLLILLDPSGKIVPAKMDYTGYPDSGVYILSLTPLSYSQSPPVYLNLNTHYTVTLGAGIKTMAGDAVTSLNIWSFTTNNSPDFIPPTFGGAISAQGMDMGSIQLTWGPAVDNSGGTPANQLIYSICYSTNSTVCQIRFTPVIINPPATLDPNGNFTLMIKPLKPETAYYFVVRVADLAGNQDSNTVVVKGKTFAGKLYVSNFFTNEILGFDHPSNLSGTTAARSIRASQNGMTDPYGMFYDQVNKRLYISTCQPTKAFTLIESLVQPFCVSGSSKIAIYDNTTTLPGKDQIPDRTIINSGLNGPLGVFLDNSAGKDTLYVANYVGKSVSVYDNVTNACKAVLVNGTCTITPRVNFSSPDLSTPFGIAFDSQRQYLYVSNYIQSFQTIDSNGNTLPPKPGTTLAVFDGRPGSQLLIPNTKVIPALKVISGFNSPTGLSIDTPNDILYVANPGASLGRSGGTLYPGIAAICNVSLIPAGSQTPLPGSNTLITPLPGSDTCTPTSAGTQYLAGSNTGFLWPVQMAISSPSNSSTPSLYVSDYSNNEVIVFSPNPIFGTTSAYYNTPYYNTPPSDILYGVNNEIRKPVGVAVSDISGIDNLYVVNLGFDQILFFDQIAQNYSQCIGPAPFLCTFPSARVISPSISASTGLFLNNTTDSNGNLKDRLYISNFLNNTIVVMDGASTLNGNSFNAINKIISSPDIQNPFGIYLDTSQSREWVYVVNGRMDAYGMYAVVVFDLAQCPPGIFCDNPPHRVIHSTDFNFPAGIWVDTQRDILFVSNRGQSTFSLPGSLALFSNSSTLNGTVSATKIIQGDQTSLLTPVGLFLDSSSDQLYVANEAHNDVLVFNQPQNCMVTQGTNICNMAADRMIYNTTDISHSLNSPNALAMDFSGNRLYVSNFGLYNNIPSLLAFDQATTANGNTVIGSYFSTVTSIYPFTFQLNSPESIALDPLR